LTRATPRLRRELHYDGRMMRCVIDRPAGIDEMLRAAAANAPDRVALVSGDQRITYAELDDQVQRLASNLARNGLGRGERIGLLVGNRPEFLLTALAAARLGAVIVPMNIRLRQPEILHMMAHSEAAALIVEESLLPGLPSPAEMAGLRAMYVVGASAGFEGYRFETLLAEHAASARLSAAGVAEDPFCIMYTSGTTGRPKGAVITHLGAVHSVIHYEMAFDLRDGEAAALAVPASHITGMVAILLSMLRVAGTTIMIDRFKANSYLTIIERERITYALLVPAMYNLCLLDPTLAEHDLSSWRVGGFGGAPMPVATIQRLTRLVPSLELFNVYGATETTSPVSILQAGDSGSHASSVGRVLPCADVAVMDEQGQEVLAGEQGELFIAGPMVIPGYWRDPEANAVSFVGGHWRSGDVGSLDAEGYLRVDDRIKDVINRGGYKIYCVEVEGVIAEHPAVSECAVVSYPDDVLGERVQAFVCTVPDSKTSSGQLREFCATKLSDYKVPEKITLLTVPLPRNSNGKILKTELRKMNTGFTREV
jgi:long-chain acyl-CoA synthetase